jgi:hypothetical protein
MNNNGDGRRSTSAAAIAGEGGISLPPCTALKRVAPRGGVNPPVPAIISNARNQGLAPQGETDAK